MTKVIGSVPTSFNLQPFGGRWFRWAEISECFWPGRGRQATIVNPELAPIRHRAGIYCVAWSQQSPQCVRPTAIEVKYIGETGEFLRRMGQFSVSAGFGGARSNGHSAAWRWPLGRKENIWVSFFEVGETLPAHLAEGLRHWMEAVALEEYRLAYGHLPEINEAKTEITEFITGSEPTR